ncbi:MAG: DUF4114 domain-containing protein [Planctomycetota bacterium]|nr:DUF4114 domain-containing protein [Planctomycetota bacterium]
MNRVMSVGGVALLVAAATAQAGYTTVNIGSSAATRGAVTGGGNGAPSGENGGPNSLVNILSRMYNGTTSTAGITGSINGDLFLNGSVTARRIEDFNAGSPSALANVFNLAGGVSGAGGDLDQVWSDGTVRLEARARYAGYSQFFGYRTSLTAGGFTGGVTSVASGYNDPAAGTLVNIGSPVSFMWMRANNAAGTNNAHYSYAALNVAQRDQMVAWEILGAGGGRRFVVAFEDINQGGSPDDRDFNDLVMELVVIPLPTGAGLSMAGLGVLAFRRRRSA